MFYLKTIFSFFIKKKVLGLNFLVFSFLFCFSFVGEDFIQSTISKKVNFNAQFTYFNALIPSRVNLQRVKDKMQTLPGVKKVEVYGEKKLKNNIKSLLTNLEVDLPKAVRSLNFTGLRIIYQNGLEVRTQELVRDFLKKFVRDNSLSISGIKTHKTIKGSHFALKEFLGRHLSLVLMVFFSILWFTSLNLIKREFLNECFLLENFQRRRNIALKSMFSFMGLVMCLNILLVSLLGTINILFTLSVLILAVLQIYFWFRKAAWT